MATEVKDSIRSGVRIAVLLTALPLCGTVGFMIVNGWSFFDSLFMAITTISTVGFEEVHEQSDAGRAFTMIYLVVGMGVFFYGVVQIGEIIVRTEMRDWLGRRAMGDEIDSLKDHFIVCGGGRMGTALCYQLAAKKLPFVAIDRSEEVVETFSDEGWHWVVGDATDDRTLLDAGLERARGLATVLASDADNLYVVLSARILAPNLQIIARASDKKNADKMEKAGANRVISLYRTGALKMAQLLDKPNLEDFFEIFTTQGGELDLAEIHVTADGPYAGRTLEQTDFSTRGVMIVGVRRANGEIVLPPPGSFLISADDWLIALGKSEAISQLAES